MPPLLLLLLLLLLLQVLLLIAVELIGSKALLGRWALASAEGDAQPGSLFSDLLTPAKALQAALQQPRKAGKAATLQGAATATMPEGAECSEVLAPGLQLSSGMGLGFGLQESERLQEMGAASPSVSGVVSVLEQQGSGEVPSSPRRSVRLQQRSRRLPVMMQQ
jgi:hypothetical protein